MKIIEEGSVVDRTWSKDERHWAALMALRGVSSSPDRVIAELLRSSCEFDRTIRDLLADSIEGKAKNGGVNFKLIPDSVKAGKIRTYHRNLKLGIEAIRIRQTGKKYEDVADTLAVAHGVSAKTIQAAISLAMKREAWLASQIKDRPSTLAEDMYRLVLEWNYDEAMTTGRNPDILHDNFMTSGKS